MGSGFTIEPVRTDADLQTVINLFKAYFEWLDLDLTFQDFENEMTGMPGKYAPPKGELLLAKDSKEVPLGCVAVRPMTAGCCEMKRLYTLPEGRGLGIGRAMIQRVLQTATQLGYSEMKLDTLPRMQAAIRLYEDFGFVRIPAYYETPLEGTVFMSCDLTKIDSDPPNVLGI